MPAPIAVELRKVACKLALCGKFTQDEVVDLLEGYGSTASLRRWLKQMREGGSLEPKRSKTGRAPLIDGGGLVVMRGLVEEEPDRTIAELAAAYEQRSGVKVSTSTVSRALAILGLTRKKNSSRVRTGRGTHREVEIYAEWQRGIDSRRLVFLDESGSTLAMTREYARSPRGERADDKVPRNRGTVITMLGALTCEGMKAMMTVEGATTTEVFETYVKCVLLPSLNPGDIVVLDNLGAHRAGSVRHLFREAGVRLKYLPPYSPDLNPIEMAWAKLKQYLKEAKARTHDALCEATRMGMETITVSDAGNWLRHCGYAQ